MTKQITLKEALKLVSFTKDEEGEWRINDVFDSVNGSIWGGVFCNVNGPVGGDVCGNVCGTVKGKIYSGEWQRVESPQQKLKRLIEETNNSELIEAFNQLEGN